MMKQNSKLQYTVLGLALLVVVASFLLLSNQSDNKQNENSEKVAFSSQHYNVLKKDKFIQLLQECYKPFIKIEDKKSKLIVSIKGANSLAQDFYNGNELLLNTSVSGNGFEIMFNKNLNEVTANFEVSKENGVNVPNDVLIKLIEKSIAQQQSTVVKS